MAAAAVLATATARVVAMSHKLTNSGDGSGNVYGRQQFPTGSLGSGRGSDLGNGKGWGATFPSGCAAGDGEGYGWGGAAGEGDPTGKCGCAILQDDEIP